MQRLTVNRIMSVIAVVSGVRLVSVARPNVTVRQEVPDLRTGKRPCTTMTSFHPWLTPKP